MKYYVEIKKDAYVDIICVEAINKNDAENKAILKFV